MCEYKKQTTRGFPSTTSGGGEAQGSKVSSSCEGHHVAALTPAIVVEPTGIHVPLPVDVVPVEVDREDLA